MKIFYAILLGLLISTAQAETLIVSGKFNTVVSAKGIKPEKSSERSKLYLYDDGTFEDSEGETYGTYVTNGNKYILNLDDDTLLSELSSELEDEDIYIDNYTPFQMQVKFNKKRTKATVKMRTSIWVTDGNRRVKISLKMDCDCNTKKRP